MSWARRLAIFVCLVIFAVFAFRAATGPVQATSAAPSVAVAQQAIEQVQLGQRVVGRNPLREQTQAPAMIDQATWRRIDLATDQRGVKYDLSFLRPVSWIETQRAVEGGTIHLVMHEIGIDGPARVMRIAECPDIEPAAPQRVGEAALLQSKVGVFECGGEWAGFDNEGHGTTMSLYGCGDFCARPSLV